MYEENRFPDEGQVCANRFNTSKALPSLVGWFSFVFGDLSEKCETNIHVHESEGFDSRPPPLKKKPLFGTLKLTRGNRAHTRLACRGNVRISVNSRSSKNDC